MNSRIKVASLTVAVALLAGASAHLFAEPAPAPFRGDDNSRKPAPQITWSEPTTETILSPGETATRQVTFTTNRKLKKLELQVSPQLTGFVSVQPTSIKKIRAGQQQTIQLSFNIPAGTSLGALEGLVAVSARVPGENESDDDDDTDSNDDEKTKRVNLQPLTVVVNLWQSFDSPHLLISLKYPPDWTFREEDGKATFSNVEVLGPLDDIALQTQSSFEVRLLSQSNPGGLSITQWFDEYFSQGFAVDPLSKTFVSINQRPAVQLETSEIGRRLHVYILHGADVIEIAYGVFAPTFTSTYEQMLRTLESN